MKKAWPCFTLWLLFLHVNGVGAEDCMWGSWSNCTVSCGNGTRTRQISQQATNNGQVCSGPASEICIITSCTATNLSALGASVVQNGECCSRPATLAIDGNPADVGGQILDNDKCAATTQSTKPWLRVDLNNVYLVSRVRVIAYGSAGQGVDVRVGNSLTNNGNGNQLCGRALSGTTPFLRSRAIWRDVDCTPSVWGMYINFQRDVTNHFLEVCEVAFIYELEIGILANSADVQGKSFEVDEGKGLSSPIDCGVSPDVTKFNALLQWKHNMTIDIPVSTSGSSPGVYQVYENDQQRLYITSASGSSHGLYSCQYTETDGTVTSKSFTLNVNVNCTWSAWSTCTTACSVGTHRRTRTRLKQHNGMDCEGKTDEDCDSKQPPCKPTSGQSSTLSVDETSKQELTCSASQFTGLSGDITFGWYRGADGSETAIAIDNAQVTNSTQDDGMGMFTGKLTLTTVKRGDAGSFKCRAFNVNGGSQLSSATSLNVKYGPESVTVSGPATQVGVKGGDISLSCTAMGNPSPSFEWKYSGTVKTAGATLQLTALRFEDGGVYTCVANNTIGSGAKSAQATVELRIEGPPQKCNVLSAISYDASAVNVTVDCPEDGNSTITHYRIEYRKAGVTKWKTTEFGDSISQPLMVVGLEPFTTYNLRATAGNKYGYQSGDAAFSSVVTVTTAQGFPGPPRTVGTSVSGSHWVVVSWSPPTQPNGNPRYYLVYYQRVGLRQARDASVATPVNVTGTSANLTMLSPFTEYSVEVAAVNIRAHDGKVMEGQKSNASVVNTTEYIPTTPRALMFAARPPSGVDVSWNLPETPNGIVRFYIVEYMLEGGSGNTTIISPVTGLTTPIDGLIPSRTYSVSVRAFTVGAGPAATLSVVADARTPSAPQNTTVSDVTSNSLTVRWSPPMNRNGEVKFYTVHYSVGSNTAEESPDIKDSLTYPLTGLTSYTNYSIYVTVTNNAKVNPQSVPSHVVEVRTSTSPPVAPQPSMPGNEDPSTTTGVFVPPTVQDSNGPIRYVDIIVNQAELGVTSPPSSAVPSDVGPYMGCALWYVAARYSYTQYEAGIAGSQFSLGSGSMVSIGGVVYTNAPLVPGHAYSIYVGVVGLDGNGSEQTTIGTPLRIITDSPSSACGGCESVGVIVGPVIASIVCLLTIVVHVLILRHWKRVQQRFVLEPRSELPLEPMGMTKSSLYDSVVANAGAIVGREKGCKDEDKTMTSSVAYVTASEMFSPLPDEISCYLSVSAVKGATDSAVGSSEYEDLAVVETKRENAGPLYEHVHTVNES